MQFSPTSHVLDPKDTDRKVGSVGQLVPNLEARIVDSEGNDVQTGQPGELWLRGPTIMKSVMFTRLHLPCIPVSDFEHTLWLH